MIDLHENWQWYDFGSQNDRVLLLLQKMKENLKSADKNCKENLLFFFFKNITRYEFANWNRRVTHWF